MIMFLEIDNISKSFGGVKALQNATLSVKEKSITGLIGPNGAGKTTLFNVISGFSTPDSGFIRFGGSNIEALKPWKVVKTGLCRTFQTPSGFTSMSVWENLVAAGSSPDMESPWRGLLSNSAAQDTTKEVSGLAMGLIDRFGLSELIDEPLHSLSVADIRFVEIARQLMTSPKVVLLDEPAAGFGPDKLDQLREIIQWLRDKKDVTVLLIEHNLSFVLDISDYVYVLAGGTVISGGSPSEVAADPLVIENYIGVQ